MKSIVIIVGTRPEAIKLAPLVLSLRKQSIFRTTLLSTGQHREMMRPIFDFFKTPPDIDLDVMQENQTLSELASRLFATIGKALTELKPDLVVVQGDTTSAFIGGTVAFYSRIKVAHIEAGLRSNNKMLPFPEEVNRRMISLIADFHFAPTKLAALNLHTLNDGSEVHLVGNTVVDALLAGLRTISADNRYQQRLLTMFPAEKHLVLLTTHRRESLGTGMENIFAAVLQIVSEFPSVHVVFPIHRNPQVRQTVLKYLDGHPSVSIIEPLVYDEMIYMMSRSHMILTDSGGIQEEAPTLNVPLIVLRDLTERPEGIEAGCAVLSGTSTDGIVNTFRKIYTDQTVYRNMAAVQNPYGDGKACERIVQVLAEKL